MLRVNFVANIFRGYLRVMECHVSLAEESELYSFIYNVYLYTMVSELSQHFHRGEKHLVTKTMKMRLNMVGCWCNQQKVGGLRWQNGSVPCREQRMRT